MGMSKTYRIGVLGLSHDHIWGNLEQLAAAENGELVAAVDPNPDLLDQIQKQYGCATYASCEELADKEEIDAVYVYGDNAGGAVMAEWAAKRGLHAMVEKPMAATLEGAERMLAAAKEAETMLMVNWPFAWRPQLQAALSLVTAGNLGDVWQVKYRAAHQGPRELGCSKFFCDWLYDRSRNGAGALMDFCCYGCALAATLLGLPSSVTAMALRLVKEGIDVEDNAIIVMAYPNKMATAEGSWTQIGKISSYEMVIYGTRGTMMVERGDSGRLMMSTAQAEEPFEVEVAAPPASQANASAHFLHVIKTGAPLLPLCAPEVGRTAQEILEAGLRAAKSNSVVSLPLR